MHIKRGIDRKTQYVDDGDAGNLPQHHVTSNPVLWQHLTSVSEGHFISGLQESSTGFHHCQDGTHTHTHTLYIEGHLKRTLGKAAVRIWTHCYRIPCERIPVCWVVNNSSWFVKISVVSIIHRHHGIFSRASYVTNKANPTNPLRLGHQKHWSSNNSIVILLRWPQYRWHRNAYKTRKSPVFVSKKCVCTCMGVWSTEAAGHSGWTLCNLIIDKEFRPQSWQ